MRIRYGSYLTVFCGRCRFGHVPSLAGHFAEEFHNPSQLLSSSLRRSIHDLPMMGFLILMPTDIVRAAFRWSWSIPINT